MFEPFVARFRAALTAASRPRIASSFGEHEDLVMGAARAEPKPEPKRRPGEAEIHGDATGAPEVRTAAPAGRREGIRSDADLRVLRHVLSLAFIWLLPVAAMAAPSEFDNTTRTRYAMKPEWFPCASDADCTLVGVGCGPSLSVAAKHKADAAAAIVKKDGKFMGCDASSPDWSVPVCDKLQCVTVTDRARAEALRKQPDVEFKVEKLEAVPVPNPPASSETREQLKALPPPNAGQHP